MDQVLPPIYYFALFCRSWLFVKTKELSDHVEDVEDLETKRFKKQNAREKDIFNAFQQI